MKPNKVEKELLKQLTHHNTLEDLFLLSPGSSEVTNLILAKILNQQHQLHVARKESVSCCPLRNSLAA